MAGVGGFFGAGGSGGALGAGGMLGVGGMLAAGGGGAGGGTGVLAPDFQILDVNTSSPTYDQIVSPRDHLGEVSAWYFGHAT